MTPPTRAGMRFLPVVALGLVFGFHSPAPGAKDPCKVGCGSQQRDCRNASKTVFKTSRADCTGKGKAKRQCVKAARDTLRAAVRACRGFSSTCRSCCNARGSDCDVQCGDGVVSRGETCDPPGRAGCAGGAVCGESCQCATPTSVTTVTTTLVSSTTTTAPPCQNGVKDGNETAVDCGGGTCPGCADGEACAVGTDCLSTFCPAGTCTDPCPTQPAGTPCASDGNACTVDQCDGSTCQHTPAAAGAACRPAAGPCDRAETCDGTAAPCPADRFASGQVCRPSGGACDEAEACTGASAACPPDVLAQAGAICRAAVNACDAAEVCTGTSPTCPADALLGAGTVCRAALGVCDVSEVCSGRSVLCPVDALEPQGELCRESGRCCSCRLPDCSPDIESALAECYGPLTDGAAGPYAGFNNWLHGSVLGGDANKGARVGDQPEANPVQRFETTASSTVVADKWRSAFVGVDGCNRVLRLVEPPPLPPRTPAELVRQRFRAEARFLRGLYYFELRRTFGAVPYVDETLGGPAAAAVQNDVDIYPAIEADFQFAGDNLPETQPDPDEPGEVLPGRPNKWAAIAFLGKVYLYQGKFAAAKALFDQVIANGKTAAGPGYRLSSDYAANFTGRYASLAGLNSEVVFAIETAGTETAVTPTNPRESGAAGCCGFFQPSFDLVNSFRTDQNGLPLPGTYNGSPVASDFGIPSATPFTPDFGALDPRIDHAVGRRGVPFLTWGDHPGADWILDQAYGGPYSPKKYVLRKAPGVTRGVTTANQALMRFADVLLMAAECEVEIGSLEKAREFVNQVRARAANPASWVKRPDGSNAANYVIGLYNTPWTDKNSARTAVRFERKLELSGEGHRFHDLVRWGAAASTIQSYLQFDGETLGAALGGASFTAGKHEVYPIPQEQIDARAPGVLQQNPGY